MARQAVKGPASRPAEGRSSMPAKEARERILAAVDELFYRDGVRAVTAGRIRSAMDISMFSLSVIWSCPTWTRLPAGICDAADVTDRSVTS